MTTASSKFFGTHPGVIGFLIVAGAALAAYAGYSILHPADLAETTNSNYDLRLAWRWALLVGGSLMYLTGGVQFGRFRDINGFLAFLLHLLPFLGLLLMLIIGRSLTPHERWERDNPGLDPKTAKRTYRNLKPLY